MLTNDASMFRLGISLAAWQDLISGVDVRVLRVLAPISQGPWYNPEAAVICYPPLAPPPPPPPRASACRSRSLWLEVYADVGVTLWWEKSACYTRVSILRSTVGRHRTLFRFGSCHSLGKKSLTWVLSLSVTQDYLPRSTLRCEQQMTRSLAPSTIVFRSSGSRFPLLAGFAMVLEAVMLSAL